jgi:hypothetical protein
VASTFPQTEEEAINKAQQYDLIYAQSGYLYTVIPDAPRPVPFGQDKPGMSHVQVDGLIGTTTHHNPYIQPPPMYGTPQYPSIYGGSSYYPPPLYQQPYPVALPPPMSGPLPTPIMHPTSQPSSGAPSTSTYNLGTSESATPSYAPYGSLPQNNLYFPFPGPPQPVSPPQGQPHAGVNFVQPSPIQQFHTFEQLNTENPWPISRIMPKIKEKTETIITQDQGEITPNKTNLLGETRIRVTRTPKGTITTNTKGGTTTTTSR